MNKRILYRISSLLFATLIMMMYQPGAKSSVQLLPLIWQQCYGGNAGDNAGGLTRTSDGGYIMIGITTSTDLPFFHGAYDIYVVKTDSLGTLQWHRCYGGSSGEQSDAILQTSDGGYIIGGSTISTDGDVQSIGQGDGDFWVVKLDSLGDVMWENQYGGTDVDNGNGIVEVEGGYLISRSDSIFRRTDQRFSWTQRRMGY
jgi:hypothetical protein